MSQIKSEVPNIVNSVTLVGRAGSNPESRYFESGSVVTKVSLAVRRANGDENPDWFPVEAWGKQAEVLGNYVNKGDRIGVIGELRFDRWSDINTKEERVKPVVRAIRVQLLGSSKSTSTSSMDSDRAKEPNYSSIEDIPF
jgi:single-strand DNA-binding protein